MAEDVDIEDPEALLAYLRRLGKVGADEPVAVRVLAGGVSNKTVLVERPSGEAWVLKQALPKLRVKVDWFSDPARIRREAEALRWLPKLAPADTITPLVFEDPDRHLMAMAAVPRPHDNWKAMLLAGKVADEHVDQFAAILGSIHRRAAESPPSLRQVFQDRTFFESLRVEPYYQYTAQQVSASADFYRQLIDDMRRRPLTLVHGDFSPKNVLVRADGRLVLLDHEVVHWGDPAFDVGFALTHLLSKANHLPAHRARLVAAALRFCETYAATLGPAYWDDNLRLMASRHTLGCMAARVAGRSPLEYLTEAQGRRQLEWAVAAMRRPPDGPAELVEMFFAFGTSHADD